MQGGVQSVETAGAPAARSLSALCRRTVARSLALTPPQPWPTNHNARCLSGPLAALPVVVVLLMWSAPSQEERAGQQRPTSLGCPSSAARRRWNVVEVRRPCPPPETRRAWGGAVWSESSGRRLRSLGSFSLRRWPVEDLDHGPLAHTSRSASFHSSSPPSLR